ncbi:MULTISPECIES: hypothetical protein [Methanobacterium]|uniref:Uncharacterized protein n=1 Tax=Methanobacterium veterum TaxID=408577 RepID=A0A9E5A1E2_9EURY|nr:MULTISPECIES: hypothetical protein [Methanobacterium]MCZ3366275.1 hypothetical protein [Methanobacterium veterum]MCZ3371783.1 hypothetical protein [Methanobacterium veterum]
MGLEGIVEMAVNDLADEFRENSDEFFNEYDFRHRFFCKLYPEFKNLIHSEYPTRKRFIRKNASGEKYISGTHCFEPEIKKGIKEKYALAVFKEEFYNKYKNELSRLDDLLNFDIRDIYIDFAFEFKYITSGDISVIREIEFDIFKLKEAAEAGNKYLIIFIKKLFGDEGFKQIIEPLNEFKKNEKVVNILIFSK